MRASLPNSPPARATTPPARQSTSVYANPFTVIVDTRESAPFGFSGLHTDSRHQYRPIVVPIRRVCLHTGDYSIVGFEKQVVVERKSLQDLFGSLAGKNGERRERFQREHERMQEIVMWGGFAHVVIEASRDDVRNNPPEYGARPQAVLSTSVKWPRRYGVAWHWAGSRAEAERLTFELLSDAWRVLTQIKRKNKKKKK